MKRTLLLLTIASCIGCSQVQSGPASMPTPTPVPRPTESEADRQERKLPKRSRDLLQLAKSLEVFEVEPCLANHTLKPIESGKFLGCKVTKNKIVTDAGKKGQLLNALFQAIGSSGTGMGCFTPRHGIRAVYKEDRIEVLICFECENFRGVSTFENFGGSLSIAPEKLFEDILAK